MYELVRGPFLWASSILCVCGIAWQILRLVRLTKKKRDATVHTITIEKTQLKEKITKDLKSLPGKIRFSVWGALPFLSVLSLIFHLTIIATPLFQTGHGILLYESLGIDIPVLSEAATDVMTVVFLASALVLLFRRIVSARVRSVSTFYDYLLFAVTAAPFVTGFLAYHQLVNYETIIIIHMLAGEIMLVFIGTTKLGHMVFFFFARFFVRGEYSLGGTRSW